MDSEAFDRPHLAEGDALPLNRRELPPRDVLSQGVNHLHHRLNLGRRLNLRAHTALSFGPSQVNRVLGSQVFGRFILAGNSFLCGARRWGAHGIDAEAFAPGLHALASAWDLVGDEAAEPVGAVGKRLDDCAQGTRTISPLLLTGKGKQRDRTCARRKSRGGCLRKKSKSETGWRVHIQSERGTSETGLRMTTLVSAPSSHRSQHTCEASLNRLLSSFRTSRERELRRLRRSRSCRSPPAEPSCP